MSRAMPTRRSFLARSAGAAAAAQTAASYAQTLGANDRVGVGVIGLGNISRGHLAEFTEQGWM